ncbi:MAG TPA: hypothetical protein VE861_00725 [Gemmatimonadaceae bacterium]|nr:hypothetical protein [Gemmatimonadaceae bacterium]
MSIDTRGDRVLEVWPIAVAKGKQVEETRRIVELMQADLTLLPGFQSATLLASGDGSALVLVASWQDESAADDGDEQLSEWLRVEGDTAERRRRDGTLTARVRVRRTVGTPPVLGDASMLQFTRYALKPGHSFGALATLTDSNLAMRVLHDTAAQGGALMAATDSGALYMLLQARNATALDPSLPVGGSMPFWGPFARREEQLLAVVATVHRR